MAQAHFDFDRPSASGDAPTFESLGFAIGWDHAHYHLTPPVEHLLADHPVRQGWQAGAAAFGRRGLQARPSVRAWLQLRLEAWARARSFEPVQVTPNFLARIEAARCPVTRSSPGAGAGFEAARLNASAAYAAGNLAMLSERAKQAMASHDWRDALAFARRLDEGSAADATRAARVDLADRGAHADQADRGDRGDHGDHGDRPATRGAEAATPGRINGLDRDEWMRLAVLMSFATPLSHAEAASLPLCVLPPARVRVLNPVQALQTILTLQFTSAPTGRRIADLAALMPGAELRRAFQVFMHTLLARRVAAGRPGDAAAQRRVMEDAWSHPLVTRRWQDLALRLGEAACQRIVETATRRGLAGSELRLWPSEAATEGWALDTGGRIEPATTAAPAPVATSSRRRSARPQPRPLAAASGTTLRS